MLAVARQRLSDFGDRIVYVEKPFDGPLPVCNAAVATLALHHVRSLQEKTIIYRNILHALAPKGIFLNGDITLAADHQIQEATQAEWREFMNNTGMSDEEISNHFREWAEEDTYFSLRDEFAALTKAGFTEPECFWKYGAATLIGGTKP
jgi:tRNA (cmo5U34)-methyltransferase